VTLSRHRPIHDGTGRDCDGAECHSGQTQLCASIFSARSSIGGEGNGVWVAFSCLTTTIAPRQAFGVAQCG
jgi:hypothetical protein